LQNDAPTVIRAPAWAAAEGDAPPDAILSSRAPGRPRASPADDAPASPQPPPAVEPRSVGARPRRVGAVIEVMAPSSRGRGADPRAELESDRPPAPVEQPSSVAKARSLSEQDKLLAAFLGGDDEPPPPSEPRSAGKPR
jgi:hypothetical protein